MNDTNLSTESSSHPAGNVSTGQNPKMSGSSLSQLSSEKVTIVIKCSAVLLIAMVGVFGNTLTLVAIRKTPSLWTKSNMLLVALASAHLFMSVIQLPYFAIFNMWVYVFAENSCYYFKAIAGIFPVQKIVAQSIHCQFIVIAADRYIAIIYPLHYDLKMTVTVIKCLIGGCYVYGLTMFGIYASYLQHIDWSKCGLPFSTKMVAIIDCGIHFSAMLVTIIVYGRILFVALQHRSKISSIAWTDHDTTSRIRTIQEVTNQINTIQNPKTSDSAVVPRREMEKTKTKKTLKEFKAARMTAVLVCAYMLPLIPYDIGRIMQACGNMQPYTVKLVDVGAALGNLNTGLVWVIYGIMNGTFRRAFLQVLKIKTGDMGDMDSD